MGLYMMFGKYSPASLQEVSAARTQEAAAMIEKNGGKYKDGYAMLGKNDILLIAEFPDTEAVVKTSLEMGSKFGISFSTTPAVTVEQFDQMKG